MILEKSLGLHVLGQWTNTHESSSNFCCHKLGKLFIWSTGSPWYFSCKTCATRFVMLLEVPVEPLILARDSLYICIFLKSLHMHIYNYIYIYIYIYIYVYIYIEFHTHILSHPSTIGHLSKAFAMHQPDVWFCGSLVGWICGAQHLDRSPE